MEPNVKLYQKIANRFKTDIANGVYQVGDMLPAERLIAEQMEVSRTVIREAMIMLEVEGYVEVRKGSGIRVINTTIEAPAADASATLSDASFMLTCGPLSYCRRVSYLKAILLNLRPRKRPSKIWSR
ncbi:GntR family transcriptional regulator [Vibrio furnissii]|uniref:GntR family transcriptional regulator n=1 Tax=Vibrio furnissii TaxID=29494 RepID=UPI001F5515A6|nr:GntR family transcriptional regulator [Vibrio furnissii]